MSQSMLNNSEVPVLDIDMILAAQKKNMQAMIGANQIVAEGFQAVAKQQAETVHGTVHDAQARVTDLMSASSPEDHVAKQADFLKSGIEQASQALRQTTEVLRKSQTEAFALLKRRMDEGVDEISDFKAP